MERREEREEGGRGEGEEKERIGPRMPSQNSIPAQVDIVFLERVGVTRIRAPMAFFLRGGQT